jgi:hypothetical protein
MIFASLSVAHKDGGQPAFYKIVDMKWHLFFFPTDART